MPPESSLSSIQRCIKRFSSARSSRGVWQAERELAARLGGRPIDINTAAAARRVGEWLRTAGAAPHTTKHDEAARAA